MSEEKETTESSSPEPMEEYIKQLEKSNQVLNEQLERVTTVREDWSTQSDSIKGVATALAKAQPKWAKGVVETGRNPHFTKPDGTPSKFQQLCDLVAKAGPILAENGLSVTQVTVPKETSAGVRMFLITTVMHGSPDTWLRSYWPMPPERKGPQAMSREHT